MKVLQVTTHLDIGGIANYIFTLTKALRQKGVDCVIASSGGWMEEELKKEGIPHRRLDMDTKFEFSPRVFGSAFRLSKIVKEEKIDIIHAHSRVSQVASLLASRMAKVPYVTTCHGYFRKRLRKIFDTWGYKVIAISDAVKTHLKDDFGMAEERIALVYSGVDIARFSKGFTAEEILNIKAALGLREGPVVGTIGRLSSVKGHRFLIQSMKDIISKKRGAQALIVGDGEEKDNLESLARSLGIGDSIHFAGADLDTHRLLSAMDVFVFPSIKEGLGIALLEALAAGMPCVASDVGGISDIVKDGSSGILVPLGDSGSISAAVLKLLDNDALRKKMGDEGKKIVKDRFSIEMMAGKVLELYKDVVKSERGLYAAK